MVMLALPVLFQQVPLIRQLMPQVNQRMQAVLRQFLLDLAKTVKEVGFGQAAQASNRLRVPCILGVLPRRRWCCNRIVYNFRLAHFAAPCADGAGALERQITLVPEIEVEHAAVLLGGWLAID